MASGSFRLRPGDAATALRLSPLSGGSAARDGARAGYTKALDGSDVIAEVNVQRVQFSGNERNPVSVGVGGSTGSYGSGVGVGVGVNLNGALGDQRGMETTLNVRIMRTAATRLVIWEGRRSAARRAQFARRPTGNRRFETGGGPVQGFSGNQWRNGYRSVDLID
jgi:hypothetical protein